MLSDHHQLTGRIEVARRTLLDDFVATIAKLPWWGALALAPIAYFALTPFSQQPTGPVADVAQLGTRVVEQMISMMAGFLRHFLPALCVIAAIVSVIQRTRRKRILTDVSGGDLPIDDLSWQAFEALVHATFEHQGYRVDHTGGQRPDGGIDLVARKNGERILVQCKHWKVRKIGVKAVRELAGVVATESADGGVLVTGGEFTREARRFAARAGIRLMNREQLTALARASQRPAITLASRIQPKCEIPPPHALPPTCPRCHSGIRC